MNPLHRRRRNFAFIILIMLILGVVLYFLAGKTPLQPALSKSKTDTNQTGLVKQEPVKQDFPDASFEGNGKWYGLCKKNSIHSIADFRKTVFNDPVLKAHFADFKWDNAQMGRLEKAVRAYVYYRKNDTIFRKKTPITLPRGDQYITDGNVRVRTTCCNSYAAAPPVYTDLDIDPSAGEPPANYNNPPPPYSPHPESIQDPTPERIVSGPLVYNSIAAPAAELPPVHPGYRDRHHHHHHHHHETPIGAPVWLLGTGLAVLIGFKRKGKK